MCGTLYILITILIRMSATVADCARSTVIVACLSVCLSVVVFSCFLAVVFDE